ncbi:hypothetical protein JOL79_31050 [Microbispora sp. RL4-1S]|uniref:Uncharacterized protein n=1 Tax=Microbispora oryzae TaxID=2806554 RepID=A0A940WMJ7_9ACTN|nr:hypothetical protein [Microbispora oryzae]MBP2708226.1 hypothetical protein [Microbispora oryzae]
MANEAFWVDHRAGRERAPNGVSRYAELLRDNAGEFDGVWGDIAPVAFASAAWRVATPPLASPAIVRWHRRVLTASCLRNGWDGSMIARLTLVSPMPSQLTRSRAWWRDRGWQGWPAILGQYVEPAERELTKIPYLRPVVMVDAPLPLDDLPPAPDAPGDDLAEVAHRALVVLARELNQLVGPLIEQLDAQT